MRRWFFGFTCLLISGCAGDIAVPSGANIECSTTSECPDGWECESSAGLCVVEGGTVPQGPSLTLTNSPNTMFRATRTLDFSLAVSDPNDDLLSFAFESPTRLSTATATPLTWRSSSQPTLEELGLGPPSTPRP